MLRVRETIRHSIQAPSLVQQQANLTIWIQEILNATLPFQVRRLVSLLRQVIPQTLYRPATRRPLIKYH
jgi:hypothetical protein